MKPMSELLDLSARFIDDGTYEGPASVNRITGRLSEVAPDIAMVEAFSHVVALRTADGLVVFDTSLEAFGGQVVSALQTWADAPVHTIVYTHGHVDHVGGANALLAAALERGQPRPVVVGHQNVRARFARYDRTAGYNEIINSRQFGRDRRAAGGAMLQWPGSWVDPSITYTDRLNLNVGRLDVALHHDRGETDDHTWAWVPQHRAVVTGDFLCWVFPNAGNPQKVQRYPDEWAHALRSMAALEPELLLPAHGLPIAGRARIARVLDDVARALETLVSSTLEAMNAGLPLDRIIHEVAVDDDLMQRPYLRAVYDEPEFVIRNIWRYYGGWYDGNPARLKPAPDAALAAELAAFAGGARALASRGAELAAEGDLRLATHLVQLAGDADPTDAEVHRLRADVYRARRDAELSLMAKGIYGDAAQRSEEIASDQS
jgi:alkyl sulfatase BDS1-like metallo-beta-lactamase superfamily hydrolase